MSTRATYGFHSSEKPDITLYIHHDGYPEGAAVYIRNALREPSGYASRQDYLTAESFIRANNRAEITRSHERHSDTEYRYDFVPSLKKRQHDHLGIISLDAAVVMRSRINFTDEWDEEVYTLREFLIKYGQEETVKRIEEQAA
tara:strand:+ start:947 stop:1375 length:429 start_codon:yes stop_codon:yes gene_type:complete